MPKYTFISQEDSRKLKALIVENGLSIERVAKIMGMGRPTLSTRINGKTDFTRKEMEFFANIVGHNPATIFFVE